MPSCRCSAAARGAGASVKRRAKTSRVPGVFRRINAQPRRCHSSAENDSAICPALARMEVTTCRYSVPRPSRTSPVVKFASSCGAKVSSSASAAAISSSSSAGSAMPLLPQIQASSATSCAAKSPGTPRRRWSRAAARTAGKGADPPAAPIVEHDHAPSTRLPGCRSRARPPIAAPMDARMSSLSLPSGTLWTVSVRCIRNLLGRYTGARPARYTSRKPSSCRAWAAMVWRMPGFMGTAPSASRNSRDASGRSAGALHSSPGGPCSDSDATCFT
mmetsp:Transcript_3680/g.10444  ORF Transcript_3680/g.10444 Transcript_3680/m.10444 type:complete len:274 (-) Transcript_3680:311-1132(-)